MRSDCAVKTRAGREVAGGRHKSLTKSDGKRILGVQTGKISKLTTRALGLGFPPLSPVDLEGKLLFLLEERGFFVFSRYLYLLLCNLRVSMP